MADADEDVVTLTKFTGLRNTVDEGAFEPGDLSVALNVDIDDAQWLRRRSGLAATAMTGSHHSIHALGNTCLVVAGTTLKRLSPGLAATVVRTDLTPGAPMSYANVKDRIYFSNGFEKGCFENGASRTWGLVPPPAPALSQVGGSLLAGRYQVAVAYLRDDGQQSGIVRAEVIDLTSMGGIRLSAIPVSTDPSVIGKRVFVTDRDGSALYDAATLDNSTTMFNLTTLPLLVNSAPFRFLSPPLAGDFIDYWNGRMLVAVGDRLYPSEAFAPELFDLRAGIPFTSKLTMLASIKGGVFIGTETSVIWLEGETPEDWTYLERTSYGAIPRTLAYGDGELVGHKGQILPFFATANGLCVGLPDGSVENLTEARFSYNPRETGAGIVRRHRGMAQFVVTLNGAEQHLHI